ncbi:GNAT family N-acetyltransferase [Gemmobacter nectariphilus]|uniref:GNAT family N-acetyltransferase n=1 Tax=Gemmobacter nectariphilus TaxID=220343 RepID=UPI0004177424|nr:GNAT family N-acetyltransferase [Gemmobacter nectariphilus]
MALTVRPGQPEDAAALAAILNAIIAQGGTTALEDPYTPEALSRAYIDGPDALSCIVVEGDGAVLGFQSLARHQGLPQAWADIATFTRQHGKVPGAGTALFAATRAAGRALGIATINATIRADNTGGLAYYRKMGFVQYRCRAAVPLRDGTLVDRLDHRLDLIG